MMNVIKRAKELLEEAGRAEANGAIYTEPLSITNMLIKELVELHDEQAIHIAKLEKYILNHVIGNENNT